MTPGLHVVLLAAGRSSRFGSSKLCADLGGRPMLTRAIETLREVVPAGSIVVVLGAHAESLAPLVRAAGVVPLLNAEHASGLASSIRVGMFAAGPDRAGVMIVLADQAALTADDLRGLVARWRQRPEGIVAAGYGGVTGVPAIFPTALFDELSALQGDRGARELLARHAGQVTAVPMPNAAVDIDTPADLAALTRRGRT